MHTFGQLFQDDRTAATALLACSTSRDLHDRNTGTLSLVFQRRQEAAPGGVRNRTAQPVVPEHPSDVQAFHRDETVATAQFQSSLVSVISPQVRNPGVQLPKLLHGLLAVLAALLLSAHGSAGSSEGWKLGLQVSGVGLVLAIGCGQKAFDADVYTNGGIVAGRDIDIPKVAGKDGEPLVTFELEADGLDRAIDCPVQLDLDRSDVLDAQLAVGKQLDAVAVGRKLDGLKSALGLEARVSGLLSGLDAAEEGRERLVEPPHRGLGRGEVQLLEPLVDEPLVCEPCRLLVVGDGNAVVIVGGLTLAEAGIVEAPMRLQHNFEFAGLVVVRVQSELECLSHQLYYTLNNSPVQVAAVESSRIPPPPKGGGPLRRL